ncbi:hypothetical protein R6V09_01045 [Streptomyces sp. W16]|uniref:hypothetical protein n=1 Tax=Streptomyces sp. W16 TaxID=3076631 RepID=UPI00295B31F9|nr:hypothetical protein [Streptomyces sp. W16]MDV9168729.1 hypothetical protein [Streptomyces sp. W16]
MTNHQPTDTAAGSAAGTKVTTLAEARAPWIQFRDALRQILDDQPTPHLVRTTARRISAEVQLTADAVLRGREAER